MAIIALGGKSKSGKDLTGKIIQYLTSQNLGKHLLDKTKPTSSEISYTDWDKGFRNFNTMSNNWEIKKFADKVTKAFEIITDINFHSLSELEKEEIRPTYINFAQNQKLVFGENVWVNALFNDYKCGGIVHEPRWTNTGYPNWIITDLRFKNELKSIKEKNSIIIKINRLIGKTVTPNKENWSSNTIKPETGIITAVYQVNKSDNINNSLYEYHINANYNNQIIKMACYNDEVDIIQNDNISETELDNEKFDYTIENNSDIEDLIEKVREILVKENII